jgi:hypothetical protein
VEQYGEGFFLQLSPNALAHWLSQPGVLARARQLQAGATAWINAKRATGMLVSENSFRERERPEYVMAHSLAHALMSEVALDCGYPAIMSAPVHNSGFPQCLLSDRYVLQKFASPSPDGG